MLEVEEARQLLQRAGKNTAVAPFSNLLQAVASRNNVVAMLGHCGIPLGSPLGQSLVRLSTGDPVMAYSDSGGVRFHAPWGLWGVGICRAWRRLVRALAETGLPTYLTLDGFYGAPQEEAKKEMNSFLGEKPSKYFIGAFPTAGDEEQTLSIEKLLAVGGDKTILTTLIERDRIGPSSAKAGARAGQWWLHSQANIEAFRRSGIDASKLHKVYIPFFPDDPHLKLVGRTRDDGPTHFYRIGVIDSRKDQEKTLLSFLRAFSPGEARLTIKTTSPSSLLQPSVCLNDSVVRAKGWDQKQLDQFIKVIDVFWEEPQLVDLHRRGDVYLSLSHGEGWDMPAFDALLSGNQLVYTASGGPQEFASEGDLLVKTKSVPCDPRYRWEPDACWRDYEVDDAVVQLREAHEHPLLKHHRRSWSGFTSADVGALMRELLEETPQAKAPPRLKKNSLAIVSLFRQCSELIPFYRKRIEALDWPVPSHIITVEGDSKDNTPDLLDAWANENARVHSLHKSLGNPLFGSTLHPLRLLTLATVSNWGLDFIANNLEVEYVLFITSDLAYEPDLAKRLRWALENSPHAGLVAPMVWRNDGTRDIFYDTWAFRRRKIQSTDPLFAGTSKEKLLTQLGEAPVPMQSVGSVLFCRAAAIYAGVRFTVEQDVVGFSQNMREAGYTIWADPKAHTQHPQKVNDREIMG